jgi:phytoene dehydrogenase-like protein
VASSFYDVIVLGAELAPLSCGALLAKRGFRVLVIGPDDQPPTYRVGSFELPRRSFAFLGLQSPVTQAVVSELGLSQSLRRSTQGSKPTLQLLLPRHRLDLPREPAALQREIEREFPNVRRLVDDFHDQVQRHLGAFDAMLQHELVWPPDTFLERREFARAAAALPFSRSTAAPDLLAEYPEGHPFRVGLETLLKFCGNTQNESVAPLALSRLYANRHERTQQLEGGLKTLRGLLVERIRAHSGDVRLNERAAEVMTRRGQAVGVRLFGSGEEVGAANVVSGLEVAALLRLLPERSAFDELFDRVGEPQLRSYRFTLNAVLRSAGVPPGMGHELFVVSGRTELPSELRALQVQRTPLDAAHVLLTAEVVLPAQVVEEVEGYMRELRPLLRTALREIVPFFDEHVVFVDSPHDGLPPSDGHVVEALPGGARRGPQAMPRIHAYPVTSGMGLCALPTRTPVGHLLLCNDQIVPGLDMEGQLLAAISTARIVSRSDRSKEWMRKGLWTKAEI